MDRKKKDLKPMLLKLKAVVDMRMLLAVFAVVLVVMGLFAYSFRQIQAGFVEEDGYLVTSRDIYDRLKGGPAEEEKNILLAGVSRDTQLFERAGKSYVGEEMEEYEADYPMYANDGASLHFLNDSASLVTEEFELLTTYKGMYVAGGNSYNQDREQADAETIFFVKLKNSLYENSLPMTLKKTSEETIATSNSIVFFGDENLRFYSMKNGVLTYQAIDDVDGLTVTIGGHTYTYKELLDLLRGAKPDNSGDKVPSDDTEPEEEPQEEQEMQAGTIIPENGGHSSSNDRKEQEEKDQSDSQEGTAGEAGNAAGSDSAAAGQPGGTGSDDGGSGKDDSGKGGDDSSGKGGDTNGGSNSDQGGTIGDGNTSGSGASDNNGQTPVTPGGEDNGSGEVDTKPSDNRKPSNNGAEPGEPPYIKPVVTVSNVKTGAYTLDYDIDISDEGNNLKKVTAYVVWDGGQQRKTIKNAGHIRMDNIRSGQKLSFRVEMKYRYKDNQYYTEVVYENNEVHTMTIEEGTNTLYLDYLADAWDKETGEGGYDYILPHQIEIRNLSVEEGTDGKAENAASTMNYARYFRVQVYEDSASHELLQNFPLSNAQKKNVFKEGGITWRSDSETFSLDSNSTYYYDFEVMDSFGDALKVVYADGSQEEDPWDTSRIAYTCKDHVTGTMSMGTASYDGQKVSVTLNNKDRATVTDLYVTVQDIYGRYVEYDNDTHKATTGTAELTDNARFMFMEGVVGKNGTLPVYAGIKGASKSPYDPNSVKQSWENLQLPAFANNTYRISLNITYNIGDRYGDVVDGRRSGTYTKVLAVRNNCKTTSLSSLGNISFSRNAVDRGSHFMSYNYTSGTVTEKLQPLMYRYEYNLANQNTPDDKLFTLSVSKEYQEIKDQKQGIWLNLPDYGYQQAKDWHLGYTVTYRDKTDRSVHEVTGELYEDGNTIVRTILVDGELKGTVRTEIGTEGRLEAWNKALNLDNVKTLLNLTEENSSLTIEQKALVSLYFAPITSGNDILLDVNANYAFTMAGDSVRSALQYAAGANMTREEQDFSDVIFYALCNYQAQLNIRVDGMDSASQYVADARADAYQSGNLTPLEKTDEDGNTLYENGDPVITPVTVTDATLKLYTLKGEPYVNMDLFVDSNQITLFDFYVLDKDGTILEPKEGEGKAIRLQLFEYTPGEDGKEGTEKLISTVDNLTAIDSVEYDEDGNIKGAQTLNFSGLTKGQTYRIKVYAVRYDLTPDGSNTVRNKLIGEKNGSTFWKDNGIWEGVTGSAISTGISLEEVVEEDPTVLSTQLLDFTTMDEEDTEWEVGDLNTTTQKGNGNNEYRITPYIDIRQQTITADGHLMKTSADCTTMVMRGNNFLYVYDADKNYLGTVTAFNSKGSDSISNYIISLKRYSGKEIAYVRMRISTGNYNTAFLGFLDEDYLTRSKNIDSTGSVVNETFGKDFNDIWGSINSSRNYFDDVKGTGTTKNTSFTTTDGSKVNLNWYYEQAVPITRNDLLMVSGWNSGGGSLESWVVFLTADNKIIMNEGDPSISNAASVYRQVANGRIYVPPKNAAKMLINYNSSDDTNQRRIQILKGTENGAAAAYRKWGQENFSNADAVTRKRSLNDDGSAYLVEDSNYEILNKDISVTPGDIYYINNWDRNVLLLDGDGKVVTVTSANTTSSPYLIIPKGVASLRLVNHRWSSSSRYDLSFVNGFAYNENGSFGLKILKCGSLKSVYDAHRETDHYANIRVQLSDSDSNYFTNNLTSDGSYYLEVYEREQGDHDLSDEELTDTSAGAVRTTTEVQTIHLLTNPDGSKASEPINVCEAIPVKKNHSYKVVLHAQVGRKGDVALGHIYFDVDSAGTEIRGIDSEEQFRAINANRYGNYVLNRDIYYGKAYATPTNTESNYAWSWNIGTFFGDLDLQGHTLHKINEGYMFDAVGSVAKKQGSIRNGTIWFDYDRTKPWSYNYFFGNNYGTLENLNFRIAINDPKTGENSYDRRNWKSVAGTMIGSNMGTIRNFTVNYEKELGGARAGGFLGTNYGLVEKGYAYGEGVRGGNYVGGIIENNTTSGTARYLYSTIDSRSNDTKYDDNWDYRTYYNGTIIGRNSGKAYGLLATGNVYTYTTTITGGNYEFDNEVIYNAKGCAIGITDTRMNTKDCYYATVGHNSRVDYAVDSKNERVEGGMLTDASWYKETFGTQCFDSHLEKLLSDGYYPWVDMGAAAEKYNIKQPYLELTIGTGGGFDLLKTEVLSTSFDDDGFETIRVKFGFSNDNGYEVTDILPEGLNCTIRNDLYPQHLNEETGFYEVVADLTVSGNDGRYTTNYPVKSVYYRRDSSSPKNSVRYSYGSYTSVNGSRILPISFYYPLTSFSDWDNLFVSDTSDWNFRIWGQDQEWDFLQTYTNADGKAVYPNPVKAFTFTGKLDGTWYAKNADGVWEVQRDGSGNPQTHVLKNMWDYTINYTSAGKINSYSLAGYLFQRIEGEITNLTFRDFSVGIERREHRTLREMVPNQIGAEMDNPFGDGTVRRHRGGGDTFGVIRMLARDATINNVHLVNSIVAPDRYGAEYAGGLIGQTGNYVSIQNCSTVDLKMISSINASNLAMGSIVGWAGNYVTLDHCFSAGLSIETPVSTSKSFTAYGVGGLMGYGADSDTITSSYAGGKIKSEVLNTGGIVGRLSGTSEVSDVYAAVNVSTSTTNAAGMVASNEGTLEIRDCLYTGSLNSASESNTIHLMNGSNTSRLSVDNCYTYQPHMEEDNSLLDDATLVSYDALTEDFYQGLFGEEYLYHWTYGDQSYGVGKEGGNYLPALKSELATTAEDGSTVTVGVPLYGQFVDGTCRVPGVADAQLEITDVWAFSTDDRAAIAALPDTDTMTVPASIRNQPNLIKPTGAGAANEWFATLLKQLGVGYYEPNDLVFTLHTGEQEYKIKSITVDGLAAGNLLSAMEPADGTELMNKNSIGAKTYFAKVEEGDGAYTITLSGLEVQSYRDNYTISIEMENGVTITKTFQFRNKEGVEEAKYLKISNAYEWNLYMGSEGNLLTKAAAAPDNSELAKYRDSQYMGYNIAGMNVEIAGTIDFKELEAIEEAPVTNVTVNNLRGTTKVADNGDTVSIGVIKNLNLIEQTSQVYGLFYRVNGNMSWVNFENDSIAWNGNACPSRSGLIGTLGGNGDHCEFTNIALLGGRDRFGAIGESMGSLTDMKLTNLYVESDGTWVGGLTGYLRGDLMNIDASENLSRYKGKAVKYGYAVTGKIGAGGLAGYIVSSDHDLNGHEIVGGKDYLEEPEGDLEDRPVMNENGWYYQNVIKPGAYYTGSASYSHDSLGYNYSRIENINIKDIQVTSQTYYAGGVASYTGTNRTDVMGYGYMLVDGIKIDGIQVTAENMGRDSGSNTQAAGVFGTVRSFMMHDITVENAVIYGEEGTYNGGIYGYKEWVNDYEHSAFYNNETRTSDFTSTMNEITLRNVTVTGKNRTGGLQGWGHNSQNMVDVTAENVTVFGSGEYIGGAVGTNGCWLNGLKAQNIKVYNAGAKGIYTGGIAGNDINGKNWTVDEVQVMAIGADSSSVGGLCGWNLRLDATEEAPSTVSNITVSGRTNVGGIAVNALSSKYLTVDNVEVSGTGSRIGGLVASVNGWTQQYLTVSHIKVRGAGSMIGGLVGYGGTSISNSTISDVEVVGYGDPNKESNETLPYTGEWKTEAPAPCGSYIGGLYGFMQGGNIGYSTIKNISVYGTGDNVGGFAGAKWSGSIYRISGSDIRVHSEGKEFVGGVAGRLIQGNVTTQMLTGVTVTAPHASKVGGLVGSLESPSTSTESGYEVGDNAVKVTVSAGTEEAKGTVTSVGGLVGSMANGRYMERNTVEADVRAANASEVGGLVGTWQKGTVERPFIQMYNNLVTAKVDGYDKVSGLTGLYKQSQWVYNGMHSYRNLAAVQVTAEKGDGADAAFFYNEQAEENGTIVRDQNISTTVNNKWMYPYQLKLWDESWVKAGTQVTATEAAFGSPNAEYDGQPLGYWRASEVSGKPNKNGNLIALVTTNDLKNPQLYQVSTATDNMNFNYNKAEVGEGGVVTYPNLSEMVPTTTDRLNYLGLYAGVTGNEDSLYLPIPYPALSMVSEMTANVNNTDARPGNQVTKTVFGYGTLVGGSTESNQVKYTMTDGIRIPGTNGSLLTGSGSTISEVLAGIQLVGLPKVYAASGYTLTLDFNEKDIYTGIQLEMFKTGDAVGFSDGDTAAVQSTDDAAETYTALDGNGNEVVVADAGGATADYVIETDENQRSYTMYYDFQTPMIIDLAVYGTKKDDTKERAVVTSLEINPKDYRSRVCASSKFLYRIGSNGDVFSYATANTPAADEKNILTTANKLQSGEKLIHMKAENGGATISGITDQKRILYIIGARADRETKTLPNFVGNPDDILTGGTSGNSMGEDAPVTTGSLPAGGSVARAAHAARATRAASNKGSIMTEIKEMGLPLYASASLDTQASSGVTSASEPKNLDAEENTSDAGTGSEESSESEAGSAESPETAGTGTGSAESSETAGAENPDQTGVENPDLVTGADMSVAPGDSEDTTGDTTGADDTGTATGDTTGADDTEAITGDTTGADDTEGTTGDTTGAVTEQPIGGELDSLDTTEETVDFDESLLKADPLYEFDYKGLHICTYVTYSLIFDEDQVTVRNMQLFVKNDRLFAINAPDQMVPGSMIIDEYQGHTYMTVLSREGRMVDLMDEIHYPDGFVNYNIKNISSNLYSDIASVQVEYEDGSIIAFNYLTGGTLYEEEGTGTEGEGTADGSDFLDYIMAFFGQKFDTAYGEVTNAYQKALSLSDYLSVQPWRDWFASTSDTSATGMAEGTAPSDQEEEVLEDAGAEDGETRTADSKEALAVVGGDLGPEEAKTETATGKAEDSETGIGSETMGALTDEDTAAVSSADGNVSQAAGAAGTIGSDTAAETADAETSEEASSDMPGMAAEEADSESTGGVTDGTARTSTASASDSSDPLGDDLIIAYDADSDGYALYAENDLLSEDEDSLVSVDQQMKQYLAAGGKEAAVSTAATNLQVSRAQQKGFVVLGVTAGLILCMILALGIQRYAKKDRRRSGRN